MPLQKTVGIVVNGTFRISPPDRAKFIDILRNLAPETRTEPGCVYYSVAIDIFDADLFHVIEGWTDRASLDAHMASPAFQDALRQALATITIEDRQAQIFEVSGQDELGLAPRLNRSGE